MRPRFRRVGLVPLLVVIGLRPAAAQSDLPTVDLVVQTGRPLRVALDERIPLKTVGQTVTGSVTEPVYAYDRIVIPVGARVRGHIVQINNESKLTRARAYAAGNFSPPRQAVLRFDTLLLDDDQVARPIRPRRRLRPRTRRSGLRRAANSSSRRRARSPKRNRRCMTRSRPSSPSGSRAK